MNRYTLSVLAAGVIDADAGTISGVSVITTGEALGHGVMIDATTLQSVVDCASQYKGGLKVKMNHFSGADAIVGLLRGFRLDGEQVRADLQLLKSSPMRALVLEMANEMPESFGLSISFSGSVDEIGKVQFVRCLEIYSCDIVDQPAANPNGLFSALVDTPTKPMATQTLDTITAELAAAIEQRNAAIAQAQTNFTNFTALNEKHTALVASFEKAQADLSAATEANATLNAELDAARKTSAEALNAEVARVLAASGHAPVALGSDKPTASQASATLTEQLEAIKDPIARTAFYRAHKAAIFAEKTSKK